MTQTDARIAQAEAKIDTRIAQVEAKIEAVKADIIKWVIGIGFAQFAAILTILKLH